MRLILNIAFCLIASVLVDASFAQAQTAPDHLPVVFAPGLGTTGKTYREKTPLIALFKARGYRLIIADTINYGAIEDREKSMVASINAQLPSGNFHLIAHSMGGLDARLAIAEHAFGTRVVSLTTLSTPHHGTSAADEVLRLVEAEHFPLKKALIAGIRDLTVENMELFNARVLDDPNVQYFSMGFYVPKGPIFLMTLNPLTWAGHHIIKNAGEGDNDGLVSVRSALWGTSLGNLPADHFSESLKVRFAGNYPFTQIFKTVIDNLDRL